MAFREIFQKLIKTCQKHMIDHIKNIIWSFNWWKLKSYDSVSEEKKKIVKMLVTRPISYEKYTNSNLKTYKLGRTCKHFFSPCKFCSFCSYTFLYGTNFVRQPSWEKKKEKKKKENKLRAFWGWEIQKQKTKIKMICISFKKNEHGQSHLLWFNRMFHKGT